MQISTLASFCFVLKNLPVVKTTFLETFGRVSFWQYICLLLFDPRSLSRKNAGARFQRHLSQGSSRVISSINPQPKPQADFLFSVRLPYGYAFVLTLGAPSCRQGRVDANQRILTLHQRVKNHRSKQTRKHDKLFITCYISWGEYLGQRFSFICLVLHVHSSYLFASKP